MYDITIDDFPPDRLAEIVHWRNDPAVNRYLRQGILTLEEVQEWYAQYFSQAEHKLFAVYADKALIGYHHAVDKAGALRALRATAPCAPEHTGTDRPLCCIMRRFHPCHLHKHPQRRAALHNVWARPRGLGPPAAPARCP